MRQSHARPSARQTGSSMIIQFELGQPSHERHFSEILRELEQRGHTVRKTACRKDCPGLVEHQVAPGDHRSLMAFEAFVRDDQWGPLSYLIRASRDYLRYLRPEHTQSTIIRERIRNMLDCGLRDVDTGVGAVLRTALENLPSDPAALAGVDAILDAIEGTIPPHPRIVEQLRGIGADVLCLTPLVVTQYGQTELVKAARACGLPTVFLVGSWDNLTTKGTVHVRPDFTFVWNDIQREEAARFHGLPPETVRVVGAGRFDDFWERTVEVSRDDHCRRFGLDPARAIITYLGSSNLISGDERAFVRKWITAIRRSAMPAVAEANVLIRPHPKFAKGWQEAFEGIDGVAIALSSAPGAKALNNDADLFHAMAHSRAVIGANTSAELEAGIVGRPVFTVKDDELETGQEGTIHFGYLAGPLATLADDLPEHVRQLEAEFGRPDDPHRNDAFLRSFLRPGGLDRRASAVTADALEAVIGAGTRKTLPAPAHAPRRWIPRLFQGRRA